MSSSAETGAPRILYIGPDSGTCRQRFDALGRLGYAALLVDPFDALPSFGPMRSWSFKTGGWGLAARVEQYLFARIEGRRFDLAYVDSGELIGPRIVRRLHDLAARVVNYNPDNPYVARDGGRWRQFRQAIPEYDLLFVPRIENEAQARAAGARDVARVWFAADDALRDPACLPDEAAKAPYRSAVSFVGTWMPERGPFLTALLDRDVPLRIFGPRWNKAPEFPRLAPHAVVGSLDAAGYNAAVAAADISIALLSKGNRDAHTTRSMEIPVLGGLLCGERTEEHLALYREGEEAVFWSDAEECAAQCHALLGDRDRLAAIAAAGRRRAILNGHFNEPLMEEVVARALAGTAPARRRMQDMPA